MVASLARWLRRRPQDIFIKCFNKAFGFHQTQKIIQIGGLSIFLLIQLGGLSNALALRKILQQFDRFRRHRKKNAILNPSDNYVFSLWLPRERLNADNGIWCIHAHSCAKGWEPLRRFPADES